MFFDRSSITISTNPAATNPRAKMAARGFTRKLARSLCEEKYVGFCTSQSTEGQQQLWHAT